MRASTRGFVGSCKNSPSVESCSLGKFLTPGHLSSRSCLLTSLLHCYISVCGTNWEQYSVGAEMVFFSLGKVFFSLLFKV